MSNNTYNFPFKTFDTKTLCQELIDAEDGAVFIIDSKELTKHEGDSEVELTMVIVKKVRSN